MAANVREIARAPGTRRDGSAHRAARAGSRSAEARGRRFFWEPGKVDGSRTPRRSPDPDGHHFRANAAGSIQICGGGPDQVLHREMDNYWPDMKHDPAKHECILQLAWAGIAKRIAPGIHLCEFGRRRSPAKSLRP